MEYSKSVRRSVKQTLNPEGNLKEAKMIKVTSVKLNTPISFGEGNLNNIKPSVGILALQNPNAQVNFQKDYNLTQKSDAVQANPLTALGYKFVKTYNILFKNNSNAKIDNVYREHISYMA